MQPMDEDRRGAGSLSINAIHRTCRINVNNESRDVSVDGGREDREKERGGGVAAPCRPRIYLAAWAVTPVTHILPPDDNVG